LGYAYGPQPDAYDAFTSGWRSSQEFDSSDDLRDHIKELKEELAKMLVYDRIDKAYQTKDDRLKEDDRQYGVHLRHCYPKNGIDGFPAFCKYGEDDICPAALYEDPWAEYLKWEENQ
jgi:hypothetical protein